MNRATQYKNADVFMICVAVNSRDSFDNIINWKTEIYDVEQDVPIMLVLTKSDLAASGFVEDPVTYEQIKKAKTEGGY